MCIPILYLDKEMKISKMGTGEMTMKMKKLMIAGMLARFSRRAHPPVF